MDDIAYLLINNMKFPADPFVNWLCSSLIAVLAFGVGYYIIMDDKDTKPSFIQWFLVLIMTSVLDVTFWFLSIAIITLGQAIRQNMHLIIPVVLILSVCAVGLAIGKIKWTAAKQQEKEYGPVPKSIADRRVREYKIKNKEKN